VAWLKEIPMTIDPKEFHHEEYQRLRQQIASLSDRISTIVQYVLGGIAALGAWILTNYKNKQDISASKGLWIPVLISFFGMVLVLYMTTRIRAIRGYLKLLEKYLPDQNDLKDANGKLISGWEEYRSREWYAGYWEEIVVGLLAVVFIISLLAAIGVFQVGLPPSNLPSSRH
jgi:hypothetical protein